MEGVLELRLPWGMIRKQIYVEMKDGKVDYESCLDRYQVEAMFSKVRHFRHKNVCHRHALRVEINTAGILVVEKFRFSF